MPLLLAVSALVAVAPSMGAQIPITCNGVPVTVQGPTQGHNTVGTEDDDVITAPLFYDTQVAGLGGNDTICLVEGYTAELSDYTQIKVSAGSGDDTVLNLSYTNPALLSRLEVALGTGADHFVGAAYDELVYGADATGSTSDNDTEVDTIDTGAGGDAIISGTDAVDSPNHDVIATGPGGDAISYAGMAGGTIDNGPDPDSLFLSSGWTGRLDIDNVAEHASVAGTTLLGWTAVGRFYLDAQPGSLVAFAGSAAAEILNISAPAGLEGTGTAVATRGGDDEVYLDGYLPAAVDVGGGRDTVGYHCDRAVIRLDVDASCSTSNAEGVVTTLAGVEVLSADGRTSLDVTGTDQDDTIEAFAKQVHVNGRRGNDRVLVGGFHNALAATGLLVRGGRGSDRLKGSGGVTFFGDRGDDILRGNDGRDQLYGGPGHDIANGHLGVDRCVAEVRIRCELH